MVKILLVVVTVGALIAFAFNYVTVDDAETTTHEETDTRAAEQESQTESGTESTVLDLNGEGLTHVPQYVFDLRATTELDLSHNNLSGALPAEVRYLQNLVILDLSDNQFTGVPAEVGQLQQLGVLDLSNNELTGLPHELGNLQNLKVLDLRGNNPSQQDLQIIREQLGSEVDIKVD